MSVAMLVGAGGKLGGGVDWRREGRGHWGPLGVPVVLQRAGCRSASVGAEVGWVRGWGSPGGGSGEPSVGRPGVWSSPSVRGSGGRDHGADVAGARAL